MKTINFIAILLCWSQHAQSQDICNDRPSCDDIQNCRQAQFVMRVCLERDDLDRDSDGQACDELCEDTEETTGAEGNDGGTAGGGQSTAVREVGFRYNRGNKLIGSARTEAARIKKRLRYRSMDSYETRAQYRRLIRIYYDNNVMPDAETLNKMRKFRR